MRLPGAASPTGMKLKKQRKKPKYCKLSDLLRELHGPNIDTNARLVPAEIEDNGIENDDDVNNNRTTVVQLVPEIEDNGIGNNDDVYNKRTTDVEDESDMDTLATLRKGKRVRGSKGPNPKPRDRPIPVPVCLLNMNPADISIPCAINKFMRGG